ncbi:hypothetical protein MHYP_G00071070 [Metynnis hypsauchen]
MLVLSVPTPLDFISTVDNSGACFSTGSLLNPQKAEIKTTCNSQPFLKPRLGIMKPKDKLLKKFHEQIKKHSNNDTEQTDFSMEVSKRILRELAAELDRLLSLRKLLIQSAVRDDKIHQEESQALILQWADELSSQQQKRKQETTQMLTEHKTTEDHEDNITGACFSTGSLLKPYKAEAKTACNSQPFLKPKLGTMKLKDLLLKKFHEQIKKHSNNDTEQTDFSMEQSKLILRELAAELDRLLSLRKLLIQSAVRDDKIHQEESQALILQWADELSSQQQNRKQETTQMLTEHKTTEDHEDSQNLDKEQRLQDAKMILSDWTQKLKRKESVKLGEECKAVLQDLCKQWKKGKLVNILPIMDFIIRILLQENKTEESMLKQWFKTEKVFSKTGGLYIPTPVWNCITRQSDEVILDPQTANPDLMLSKDGRSVRTKTYEESTPNLRDEYQRTHSKYDGWTCVLAKKGYETGSYYWEVDVSGKNDWRIGVVKDSAPRHGYVNMNTTAGYWTLRLQLGSLMALTDPVTKLNHIPLSKIGVNLDIEEGRVSFYDSEKRRHIYTFKTVSKSEKIYPVFGTVETDRALRISPSSWVKH